MLESYESGKVEFIKALPFTLKLFLKDPVFVLLTFQGTGLHLACYFSTFDIKLLKQTASSNSMIRHFTLV
jgi:hypothetical protein